MKYLKAYNYIMFMHTFFIGNINLQSYSDYNTWTVLENIDTT